MSILKTVLILAAVVAAVSAGPGGRWGRKGRRFNQRGRTLEGGDGDDSTFGSYGPGGRYPNDTFAGTVDTAEVEENQAALGDALAAATDAADAVAAPEELSAPEAQAYGTQLTEDIGEAAALANEGPQAPEVQAAVVAAIVEETHDELEKNLNMAKKHQMQLSKYGATMSPEDVVKHQVALHKHLELAFHFAEQHSAAVQQDKAIEEGASPVEVAEMAPAGRRMGQKQRGRGRRFG